MNKINPTIHTKLHGFTIVELLIVIVVIAILAAISIAAYTNIQDRAKNTATISAVEQTIKAIHMYIAETGEYPATNNGSHCLTTVQACAWGTPVTSGSELRTKLTKYSSLPDSIPDTSSATFIGIVYNYNRDRTFNTLSKPVIILYALNGANQKCQLSNVTDGGMLNLSSSTSGRTGNDNGATICVISIYGPGV